MKDCRLIYKSVATEDVLTPSALVELANGSAANNRKRGITGLLVLSGDRFLQVLEGDSRVVNTLYRKIVADKRHRSVELVNYEATDERYFADWGMRLLDLSDLNLESRRVLMSKYSSEDGFVSIPTGVHAVYSLLLDARAICAAG